jgi:hypothetical protein
MSNARLYALDEVSTGLDSQVTLHIFHALKDACALNKSSIVTALQQVTPETYALFDDIILLRDGHVIFHGPRTEIGAWLAEIMSVPFIPDSLEEAGFLIDLLSDPKTALDKAAVAHRVALQDAASGRQMKRVGVQMSPEPARSGWEPVTEQKQSPTEDFEVTYARGREGEKSETPVELERVTFHLDAAATPAGQSEMPAVYPSSAAIAASNSSDQPFKRTPEQLEQLQDVHDVEEKYRASKHGQRQAQSVQQTIEHRMETAERTMNVARWSPYTKTQYGQRFPHSTMKHTVLCSQRQVKLLSRNLTMVIPRTANAVIMGLVYGTVGSQTSAECVVHVLRLLTFSSPSCSPSVALLSVERSGFLVQARSPPECRHVHGVLELPRASRRSRGQASRRSSDRRGLLPVHLLLDRREPADRTAGDDRDDHLRTHPVSVTGELEGWLAAGAVGSPSMHSCVLVCRFHSGLRERGRSLLLLPPPPLLHFVGDVADVPNDHLPRKERRWSANGFLDRIRFAAV